MANDPLSLIFWLIVLLFSVMVHEVSHGVVAYALGDDTAKEAGRLTLNPLKHLDVFGSILLPLFIYFISNRQALFGWAKPVPYNPYRLKNPVSGAALIGIAGPISNFALAIIFGILVQLLGPALPQSRIPFIHFLNIIVFINLLLGVFNLVPIPPLDGSKLLFAAIPDKYIGVKIFLEQYGLALLLLFIFFGFGLIVPIINALFSLLVGPWASL